MKTMGALIAEAIKSNQPFDEKSLKDALDRQTPDGIKVTNFSVTNHRDVDDGHNND